MSKDIVRRFYHELWNQRALSIMPEIMAEDVTFRGSLGPVRIGHDGFADYLTMVHAGLEDYECVIEDLIEEGGRVVAKMTFQGRHAGDILGYPATGKRVSWAGCAFFTCVAGKISDLWVLGDLDGLKSQLATG